MTQQHELVVPGASNLKKEEEQRMYSDGTMNQKLEVLEVKEWGCLQYPHPVIVNFLLLLSTSPSSERGNMNLEAVALPRP